MDKLLKKVETLFKEADPRAEDLTLTPLTHGDLAQILVALKVTDYHNQASQDVLIQTIKKRKALK